MSSYISKRAAWATWDPVSQQQVFEAYGYSDYSHQSDEGQTGKFSPGIGCVSGETSDAAVRISVLCSAMGLLGSSVCQL